MSIGQILFQFFIRPLELIFEIVYGYSKVLLGDSGLSIIVLSLCMNLLLLPLYNRADAIQEAEREKGKSLARWADHIKKTFSGDERFMLLQTYYRQNDYKPYYALKALLPLLLEIPFFMAAYHFLSHLSELVGCSFGPIASLGSPDGLLKLGGVTIHVLPVLMTLINLLSGALYTKGQPLKEKLQLFAMAGVFLVLLYNSPSGLVLYWTLNNLFSLVKNLINRLPNRKRILRGILLVLGLALMPASLLMKTDSLKYRLFVLGLGVLLCLPWMKQRTPALNRAFETGKNPVETEKPVFWQSAWLLTLLTGVMIPSAVVMASPAEFVMVTEYHTPLLHLLNALLASAGLFLLWMGIFYRLSGPRNQRIFGLCLWVFSITALINYMFFATDKGLLTAMLQYEKTPEYLRRDTMFNLAVLLLIAAVLWLVWRKKRVWVRGILMLLMAAVFVMSAYNCVRIQAAQPPLEAVIRNLADPPVNEEGQPLYHNLSRKGQNVVILMLDRAIGAYLPYLFQERPELAEQFAGFTYYPNTLSYGAHTNIAAPALFGGYEYTPEEMNRRAEESLASKSDEALKVMPALFSGADWQVTFCDPPHAGYSEIPDTSIFAEYPGVKSYLTEWGQLSYGDKEKRIQGTWEIWRRNFFCYGLMKTLPLALQAMLYQGGSYFEPNYSPYLSSMNLSEHRAEGFSTDFNDSYGVLEALPRIVGVREEQQNTLFILTNCTTHDPVLLQEPAYEPALHVDNSSYDAARAGSFVYEGRVMKVEGEWQRMHYQIHMAALIKVGQWMDALRDAGVYDNTRIIIVADHGTNTGNFADMKFGESFSEDALFYNPLLLVKDFGEERAFQTDRQFMTNADVPLLAMAGLIENPVNPFTGRFMTDTIKRQPRQKILGSHEFDILVNNGNTFLPAAWYSVGDDIFDMSSWKTIQD